MLNFYFFLFKIIKVWKGLQNHFNHATGQQEKSEKANFLITQQNKNYNVCSLFNFNSVSYRYKYTEY